MAGTWIRLAHVALSSAATSIDSGTFTANENLKVIVHTTGTDTETQLRFNGDSGSNYASRRSGDGGSDSTFTSQTQTKLNATGDGLNTYLKLDITNIADKEKLIISEMVAVDATGSSNAPRRSESVSKWVNTSAQITSIQVINHYGGGATFAAGSYITVFGASGDVTSDTTDDGSIFEESDTGKHYIWNATSDSWTEVA